MKFYETCRSHFIMSEVRNNGKFEALWNCELIFEKHRMKESYTSQAFLTLATFPGKSHVVSLPLFTRSNFDAKFWEMCLKLKFLILDAQIVLKTRKYCYEKKNRNWIVIIMRSFNEPCVLIYTFDFEIVRNLCTVSINIETFCHKI